MFCLHPTFTHKKYLKNIHLLSMACSLCALVSLRIINLLSRSLANRNPSFCTLYSLLIMKTTLAFIGAALSAVLLSSCGAGGDPIGLIFSDVNSPRLATSATGTKVGTSMSKSYLGLIAVGDSSINAAKQNGGIRTVSSVDKKVTNIFGFYAEYTTTVSGN